MTDEITINPANDAHLDALLGMIPHMDRARDAAYFTRCMAETVAGNRAMVVAENEVRVVGYVMLNRQSRYPSFRRMNIPEIQDLYVLPAFRRGRVGERLVAACEAQARADACDMIGLAVGLHAGFGAAQRLYVRLGYMPDGAGMVYDMDCVGEGAFVNVDDDLNLMMVKDL